MSDPKIYSINDAKIWLFAGDKASWHFVTVPVETSEIININHSENKKSFGSIRVEATIGSTTWGTSVFFDSKSQTFCLPIKADIRKKENLAVDDNTNFKLSVQ